MVDKAFGGSPRKGKVPKGINENQKGSGWPRPLGIEPGSLDTRLSGPALQSIIPAIFLAP